MRQIIRKLPLTIPKPSLRQTPVQALRSVTSKTGLGVYASNDLLYKGAVFGRDSLEVAEDLMYIKPRLVEKIILTLSCLQGQQNNPVNEEEPGKIVHEYRTPLIDGRPLGEKSATIYKQLSSKWGGTDEYLAYYGSIDATPHYIKVVSLYCAAYGMEILTNTVINKNGQEESVLSVLDNALGWLIDKLETSHSGLLEYKRRNQLGIENQVWKDSKEFYVHENGKFANHEKPISSIEVQALAYDALVLAAELLPSYKNQADKYATSLQQNVIDKLWSDKTKYFFLGTDYDAKGQLRAIKTKTANPAALLDSRILLDLPAGEKRKYVSALVREIMGTDFLTDAGIRSRALSSAKVVHNWDYHGSFVTWPKETYDIAKGLRRHSFPALSRELENRLLNVIRVTRSYPEFIYVDHRGRVLGIPTSSKTHGEIVVVASSQRPERVQAWTVSAVVAINNQRRLRNVPHFHQFKWQRQLEAEVLRHIPIVQPLRSKAELSARYPSYPYELDGGEK